jgi:hypothetical protein
MPDSALQVCKFKINYGPADPEDQFVLPNVLEDELIEGKATCVAFNRRGTILAGDLNPLPLLTHTFQSFHSQPTYGPLQNRTGCIKSR